MRLLRLLLLAAAVEPPVAPKADSRVFRTRISNIARMANLLNLLKLEEQPDEERLQVPESRPLRHLQAQETLPFVLV